MAHDDTPDGDAAVGWVLRLREPAFDDWDAFTDWLEADPRRNALYEQAALADRDLGEVLASAAVTVPVAANENPPLERISARAGGLAGWSAAAAALLLAVTAYPLLRPDDGAYDVTTAGGEQRRIVLADGTRIDMNGGTRLTLHRNDERLASLSAGEATFSVVHDAARPFAVQVGGDRIEDVGTVFNVARAGPTIEVGVAEGAVTYRPQGEKVALAAGQTLTVTPGGKGPVLGRMAPAAIGAWRQGRLVYSEARIRRIAADLSRYLGVPVTPDPTVADRTFDGVIMLDHDPGRLFAHVAPLLDVVARPSGRGWQLASPIRETP